MEFDWFQYILVGLASLAAGAVNALAGGGTLITFPVLVFIGVPPVAANITNTVALVPGYLGGALAQFKQLKGQRKRMAFIPVSMAGGIAGGILLLNTGEELFQQLIPFLILLASGLLAVSDRLRGALLRRLGQQVSRELPLAAALPPLFLTAVYGGYFAAGQSVITLAVLGLVLTGTLNELNALKQVLAFVVSLAAAIFYVFSGEVVWQLAAAMAAFALLGGALGGRLASRIRPATLRWVVVTIGVAVALIYLLRG